MLSWHQLLSDIHFDIQATMVGISVSQPGEVENDGIIFNATLEIHQLRQFTLIVLDVAEPYQSHSLFGPLVLFSYFRQSHIVASLSCCLDPDEMKCYAG